MAWSRKSTVKKARNTGDTPGGYKLKSDPTLPATSKAIVDSQGKRQGSVKKMGSKFAHSKDNYEQKFDSAQAALRQFALRDKASESSPSKAT